jgi:hypothetical protein
MHPGVLEMGFVNDGFNLAENSILWANAIICQIQILIISI